LRNRRAVLEKMKMEWGGVEECCGYEVELFEEIELEGVEEMERGGRGDLNRVVKEIVKETERKGGRRWRMEWICFSGGCDEG
jgi:hypothetical protein